MNLIITYKNSKEDIFEEKHLDCSNLTVRGHASKIIDEWLKPNKDVYKIDHYNAVLLDEVVSIRVVTNK